MTEKVVGRLKENYFRQYQFIGLRANKNIYNRLEALVIPAFTILSRKDIEMLIQQGIALQEDDVEQGSILHLVDDAITEIKVVFEKVRYSNYVPLDNIHEKIIPIIILMSHRPDLKDILTRLEQHDEYTYRHSIGVALFSRLIGKAKGFHERELLELTTAGFLHDIGKAKIPEEIINKPGKLTLEEFNIVKNHTLYGFDLICNSSGVSRRHALVALQHHEREDGSGYPYAVKAEDIDEYSKIVAVADVFHAMISKRVYKNPVPFYKVLQEMSQNAYGPLEPKITLCFLKRIMDMMIGNDVLLSNGMQGKIIMISPNDPVNPLVDANGTYIDLSKEQTIYLEKII